MLTIICLTTKTDKLSKPEKCLFDNLLVQFITSNSLVGVTKSLFLILFPRVSMRHNCLNFLLC